MQISLLVENSFRREMRDLRDLRFNLAAGCQVLRASFLAPFWLRSWESWKICIIFRENFAGYVIVAKTAEIGDPTSMISDHKFPFPSVCYFCWYVSMTSCKIEFFRMSAFVITKLIDIYVG